MKSSLIPDLVIGCAWFLTDFAQKKLFLILALNGWANVFFTLMILGQQILKLEMKHSVVLRKVQLLFPKRKIVVRAG